MSVTMPAITTRVVDVWSVDPDGKETFVGSYEGTNISLNDGALLIMQYVGDTSFVKHIFAPGAWSSADLTIPTLAEQQRDEQAAAEYAVAKQLELQHKAQEQAFADAFERQPKTKKPSLN